MTTPQITQGASGANPVVTSITFGSGTALNDYEEGTWTPIDASGASLTITNTRSTYTKIGRHVSIQMHVTYPATADGSAAALSGLPFTVATNADSSGNMLQSTSAIICSVSGTAVIFWSTAVTRTTNANLNNANFFGNVSYPAT